MTNPTSNFGWQMPTSTDLVTDLPADFEIFGQAVDTSMADLKGGTTGQILAKASNTNMDFTWVTNDVGDITAVTAGTGISGGGTSGAVTITNSMATEIAAKGDLIAGTGSQTFDNVSVGTNGQVLTADSTAATGLAWTTVSGAPTSLGYAAGKNKIVNGDFYVNQRNFTSGTASDTYGFDRWLQQYNSSTPASTTYSAQTFTPGTAPVAGYEGKNFARQVTTSQVSAPDYAYLVQRIESVRTLANQTVVVSFWAKAASGTPKVSVEFTQLFGSGGSPSSPVRNYIGQVTLSTSWTRYSVTASIASISGKTIGTAGDDWLGLYLWTSAGSDYNARTNSMGLQNNTFDFWGVQVENGTTATAFQTASGSIQGELAMCQRYYFRNTAGSGVFAPMAMFGVFSATNTMIGMVSFPVAMRTTPSSVDFSTLQLVDNAISTYTVSAVTLISAGTLTAQCDFIVSGATANRTGWARANNSSTAYLGFSAEL
jgi:hypothetical protein